MRALEESGLSLERALEAGQRKDGGLTPAQLAWVLSQISIGDEARVPGGGAAPDLRLYLRDLIDDLGARSTVGFGSCAPEAAGPSSGGAPSPASAARSSPARSMSCGSYSR